MVDSPRGWISTPPASPKDFLSLPRRQKLLLHFRTLERILRGSCENISVGMGKIFHAGEQCSHHSISATIPPHRIHHICFCSGMRVQQGSLITGQINHSYEKEQGRLSYNAHSFQFSYFAHISVIVQTQERSYSAQDSAHRAELYSLTASIHLVAITRSKAVSDFPIGTFVRIFTPNG